MKNVIKYHLKQDTPAFDWIHNETLWENANKIACSIQVISFMHEKDVFVKSRCFLDILTCNY